MYRIEGIGNWELWLPVTRQWAHSQKKGYYQSYLSTTDTRSETDKDKVYLMFCDSSKSKF
ncbi:MAG: hypothetical protein DRR08_11990 [Candidatus Parabeggiatoa sp. nov. 2]|nr:MAG: hypothetical protein DRR08_11990 [Gammaproteobacteria bacterium]